MEHSNDFSKQINEWKDLTHLGNKVYGEVEIVFFIYILFTDN